MPRIRLVEVSNFRCIRELAWFPRRGLNVLVGPGDAGKSTVLEAIDYCLGARRALAFSDADFYALDTSNPIRIRITVGELPPDLITLDAHDMLIRGFDAKENQVVDEPGHGLETVLTLQLTVDDSLEPVWSLFSERAATVDQLRTLAWGHRVRIAPVRLGAGAGFHLAWRPGSLLSRLTPDLPSLSSSLAAAARDARAVFGEKTGASVKQTLDDIRAEAASLGIDLGDELKAMLDADSISLSRGTVSLHDAAGIPLQGLGTGSLRLLVVALQRKIATGSSIVLVDEVEYGLEPHRICRLLDALGAKDENASAQVFMTTHSPVAVRELSSDTLFVLREQAPAGTRVCVHAGNADAIQGTIRKFPEALLGRVVIACEGASEVGLLRGLDQYEADEHRATLASRGVVVVDGGGVSRVVGRAMAFHSLGFQTSVLRDDDRPAPAEESAYLSAKGRVFTWEKGQALEEALFADLPESAVLRMVAMAVANRGERAIDDNIKSASDGALTLASIASPIAAAHRAALALAAKASGWFKSVSDMEQVGREVVGPALAHAAGTLPERIKELRTWANGAAS